MIKPLAFFSALPGIFSGLGIVLISLVSLFSARKLQAKVVQNYCIGLSLLSVCIAGQLISQNRDVTIIAIVSDANLREVITRGVYQMENGVDVIRLLRLIIAASVLTIIFNHVSRRRQEVQYVGSLVMFLALSYLISFLSAYSLGANQFKHLLSAISSLDSSNYLTSDGYGYRISGFFHEPSQASVFAGTTLACSLALNLTTRRACLLVLFAVTIFLLSRSITVLIIFSAAFALLKSPKSLVVFAIGALWFFQSIVAFILQRFEATGLLRSIYERSFRSQVFGADVSNVLVGFDFGEVYSFEPIWGISLQVGYIGLAALYFFLQRDLRTFSIALLCFAASPQMWFWPSWLALAVFAVTSHALDSRSTAVQYSNHRMEKIRV